MDSSSSNRPRSASSFESNIHFNIESIRLDPDRRSFLNYVLYVKPALHKYLRTKSEVGCIFRKKASSHFGRRALNRELREKGYTGSDVTVRRHVQHRVIATPLLFLMKLTFQPGLASFPHFKKRALIRTESASMAPPKILFRTGPSPPLRWASRNSGD